MRDAVHVSIDIETLGLKDDCKIASVGVFAFILNHPFDMYKNSRFHLRFDVEKQIGRSVCAETLNWWDEQSIEARKELKGVMVFKEGLKLVNSHLQIIKRGYPFKKVYFWANSPNFDFKILDNAFNQIGLPFPIPFYSMMDYRTLREVHREVYDTWREERPTKRGTLHNAYEDAKYQAEAIYGILNAI